VSPLDLVTGPDEEKHEAEEAEGECDKKEVDHRYVLLGGAALISATLSGRELLSRSQSLGVSFIVCWGRT
jgi:hypothetical protein